MLEVLVKPFRDGKPDVARQYINILTKASGIEILDITSSISERAAKMRADYNLRTPDAIQLGTALQMKADYFLTNDNRLKPITEIEIVILSELQ